MTHRIELLESGYYTKSDSECWLWSGQTNARGYGFVLLDGKTEMAHRASYKEYLGPVPDGMLVCHRCDVPGCINPDHLFLGTHQDNMDDMIEKGRQRARGGKPVMHKRPTVTAAIPRPLWADLKTSAARRGQPVTRLMQTILEDWLEQEKDK